MASRGQVIDLTRVAGGFSPGRGGNCSPNSRVVSPGANCGQRSISWSGSRPLTSIDPSPMIVNNKTNQQMNVDWSDRRWSEFRKSTVVSRIAGGALLVKSHVILNATPSRTSPRRYDRRSKETTCLVWDRGQIASPGLIVAISLASVVAICIGLRSAQLAANHRVSGGTYEYGYP
jgi:hypothetical protein